MQGKVEICGVNTAKLKVLKNEETMELLRRTKEGDMEAREQLIAGNLRLVLSVIQKFSNRGENADDLFQVGCIGLIKAIDNFNTELDVRFSTYGVPMGVDLGKWTEEMKTDGFRNLIPGRQSGKIKARSRRQRADGRSGQNEQHYVETECRRAKAGDQDRQQARAGDLYRAGTGQRDGAAAADPGGAEGPGDHRRIPSPVRPAGRSTGEHPGDGRGVRRF